MLRWGLLIVGLILIGIGVIFFFMPGPQPDLPLFISGVVLTIAVLCERWRYVHKGHSHSERWQRTDECFEDPETGLIMDVFYDPASGERKYVPR